MSLKEMYSIGDKLADYLDRRSAAPLGLAEYMSNLSEGVQEMVFDFCLGYLDALTEKESRYYGPVMARNRALAIKLKRYREQLGNNY